MNTTIRKVNSPGVNEHLVIVTSHPDKLPNALFSKAEETYIKSEIKKKNKLIAVNQYTRWVFLQSIDTDQLEPWKALEKFRKSGDQLATILNRYKIDHITITGNSTGPRIGALIEGMLLGNYQFLKYKSDKDSNTLRKISIHNSGITSSQLKELDTVCDAVYKARDLVNIPLCDLSASGLAKAFRDMGRDSGFKVKIYDKKQIRTMKMGGLLAVNQGSLDPPTFTVMEWKPARPANKKPYILVGKGVVYDTGGLSLKPTPGSMDYMKSDMAGAAAAGCIMWAVATLRLPLHVIALVPATDNRPDGNAYTPGDVITMMSGLKVEVLNTDAEGRMILADALHYAKRYKPELVLEFSTLTGAAANAIGHYGIVAMGECDDATRRELHASANHVYERLAEFPFWEEYDELIKSDIADIKNIGGPIAGAITAGRFLRKFTDYPYMHFDIAGPSFGKSNDSYRGKNGTGVGVRFMIDFLMKKAGR